MKRLWLFLPLFILLLFSLGAGSNPPETWTIVYTGAAHGKITPCACSAESDLGGLLRRDTALVDLLKTYPEALLVDAGGAFDEPSPQNRAGAKAMADSLQALGYTAAALGPNELLYGRAFLEALPGSFFVSNVRWKNAPSPLSQTLRRIDRGDQKLEIVALVNPADIYAGDQAEIVIEDPLAFLNRQCRPDTPTLVLCATDPDTARRWLAAPEVEIVLNANPRGDLLVDPPFAVAGGKIYAEAAIYGSRLGILEVSFDHGLPVSAHNRFLPLDNRVADGARVAEFRRRYEAETKRLFLEKLAGQSAIRRDTSPYAGSSACADCHPEAMKSWQESRHSKAWESLRRVKKTFDPECVACHVVGYEKPGGFLSETDTPHLIDVGCEACHGPAKEHVHAVGGSLPKLTLDLCLSCHNAERSPAFEPKTAWVKIRHR
ncbi:MAG: hypothetical protein GX444_13665 [Myxococcales bacterium]|nr:hypothetical protein [Myxococcales bacterium]